MHCFRLTGKERPPSPATIVWQGLKDDIDVSEAHAAQDSIGTALARSRSLGKIVWSPSPAL
jgi:hypothetical protein